MTVWHAVDCGTRDDRTVVMRNGRHPIPPGGAAFFTFTCLLLLGPSCSVCLAQPANSQFAGRATLSGVSPTASGSNVLATKETGEPHHGGNAGGASVWWTWTAPGNGSVVVSTAGSSFDTLLGVYTGGSVGTLSLVAGNDDDPDRSDLTSKVAFTAASGTAYQIAVDGFDGETGSISLSLTFTAAAAPLSLGSPQRLTGGEFRFNLQGSAGKTYVIEATTNFSSWLALATNTITSPPLTYTDAGSTGLPRRFYRAREQSQTAPSAPTGLQATAGNAQITLSWNAVDGAASYVLYMARSSGVNRSNYGSLPGGARIPGIGAASHGLTSLNNGSTYYFVVTAVNGAGESSESAQVSAMPSLTAPPPPLLAIHSAPPAQGTAGTAYSFAFQATGGTPPYSWSASIIAPDSSDNGLSLDANTGLVTGTPSFSGRLPFAVRVQDAAYKTVTAQYDLVFSGNGSPHFFVGNPVNGVQGSAYAYRFQTSWGGVSGCQNPNLLLIQGSIPPGLTLNTLSGDLGQPPASSGTPAAAGTYTFTVSADPGLYCVTPAKPTDAITFTINIASSGSPASPPGASNWQRQGGSPVLSPTQSSWDDFKIRAPSVIKVGATYIMYYEGEDAAGHKRQIGRATSNDGVTWVKTGANPVLTPGAAGSWDALEVRYPSVHFDGTTYRLWYWGWNGTDAAAKIGLATSSDGITWTRHASPVLGAAYGGSGYIPGSVLKPSSQFVMYYANAFGRMARASSTDGVVWTEQGEVLQPGSKCGRPSVTFDGTTYRMWLTQYTTFGGGVATSSPLTHSKIVFASSTDGTTWTPFATNPDVCFFCKTTDALVPLLGMGPSGAWDRPGVSEPSVVQDGASFKMWYAGGSLNIPGFGSLNSTPFAEGAIGLAVIP